MKNDSENKVLVGLSRFNYCRYSKFEDGLQKFFDFYAMFPGNVLKSMGFSSYKESLWHVFECTGKP